MAQSDDDRDLLAQRFEDPPTAPRADRRRIHRGRGPYRRQPRVVFSFTVQDGRVVGIDLLGAAETLESLELARVQE